MESINNIANKLIKARKEKNLSIENISKKTGIEQNIIKLMENSNSDIDFEIWFLNVYKYADFLNVYIKDEIRLFREETEITLEKEVGMILKYLREKANLSIVDVSLEIKVSKKILVKIENGNIRELSSFYRKNYIKKYAKLLNMNLDPYEEYLSQADTIEIKTKKAYPQIERKFEKKIEKSIPKSINKKPLIAIVTVIIIILISGLILNVVQLGSVDNVNLPYHVQYMPSIENIVSVDNVVEEMAITDVTDPNNYEVDKTFEVSNVDSATVNITFIGDCYVQSEKDGISYTYSAGETLSYDLVKDEDLIIQLGNVSAVEMSISDQPIDLSELSGVGYIEIKVV